jgi:N,N'-diacetyllegionaminate synthase
LGAKIIELHFTDDKTREFRDHHISVDANDLLQLKENINRTITLLGSAEKVPVPEVETVERIQEFRRACFLKNDLEKGGLITAENLTTLRPCKGIDARDFSKLIGKRLTCDKRAFTALSWDEIE